MTGRTSTLVDPWMGQVAAIREKGSAYATAQMEIILTLAQEFQDAINRNVALPPEIVILRFMEALRRTWSCAKADSVSPQVFKMWQSLQQDLKQLIGPSSSSAPDTHTEAGGAPEDQG